MKRLQRKSHLAYRLGRIRSVINDTATFPHGKRHVGMFEMLDMLKSSAQQAATPAFNWNLNFPAALEIHEFLGSIEEVLTALSPEEEAQFKASSPIEHDSWVNHRDGVVQLRTAVKQCIETCRTHSRYYICGEHLKELVQILEDEGV